MLDFKRSKNFIRLVGLSLMSPVIVFMTLVLFLSWISIVVYSKIFHKDETKIEETIEHVVEKNIENVLSLPSGALEDKFSFMVQPIQEEAATKDK